MSELFKIKPIEKENLDELQTLVNCFSTNIEHAKRVSSETSLFDQLIIFMVSSKLDEGTRKSWENHIKNEKLPTWDILRKFLEDRVAMLVSMRFEKQCVIPESKPKIPASNQKSRVNQPVSSRQSTVMSGQTFIVSCAVCKMEHKTHLCPELLKLDVPARIQKIKNLKLCFNCLKNHNKSECKNKFTPRSEKRQK